MVWLIRYYREITAAIVAAAFTSLLWGAYHSYRVRSLESSHKAAMSSLQEDLVQQCNKDKQITTEVSYELQTQLTDARRQLDAAKRVQRNRCIPTPARPAAGHDATSANQEFHQPDGLYADVLLDFAYDAEVVGRQLDSCQSFITKTWEAKGQ